MVTCRACSATSRASPANSSLRAERDGQRMNRLSPNKTGCGRPMHQVSAALTPRTVAHREACQDDPAGPGRCPRDE